MTNAQVASCREDLLAPHHEGERSSGQCISSAQGENAGSDQAQGERPNKYLYPEFAGITGERYLLSLAEQFAPLALWRTWYAAVSFQAPGQQCYVGVGRMVERVGPKERKIYLDLAALEARGWLTQERARLPFVQEDGSTMYGAVTMKDFTGFYNTAHDYHLWIHSPDYIAPERENIPLMLADPELAKRLIRFENYRRLLLCGKPGKKADQERQDYHSTQLEALEQVRTSVQEVNQYFNGDAHTDSLYRVKETSNNRRGRFESFDLQKGKGCSPPGYTKNQDKRGNRTPTLESKTEDPPTHSAQRGAATKDVKTELGYTEEELKQDLKKRGAAAAGIPAEQYTKLNGGQDQAEQEEGQEREARAPERPEREIPNEVEKEMTTYARLYDDTHLIASDVTRFKKMFATAEQALHYFEDTLFWAFYDEARKAAAKHASKRHNSKGRVNRVPYMFTCLENALNFSLEELVYLRTENPLYTDYSLYDVVEHLRKEHQQHHYHRQTSLDYREWLQWILDKLERCKEPKQRKNPTTREY